MLRPLLLLLAGLLLVLISISWLQGTWLATARRERTQHTHRRTPGEKLAAQLRGPWSRTIIAAGGVVAGFILCLVGAVELLALLAQVELR